MTTEEIMNLVEEYSLTLRCFPTHIVSLTRYREGYVLKEGETIVDHQFKNMEGPVKMLRHEEFREPRWGVKVGDWPHWTKYDFYGRTAEKAVMKAVEHIKNNKEK